MAGRFPIFVDENSAKGIANEPIERGWDVVRGLLGLPQGTDDEAVFEKAVELNRVLLTRDTDLERIGLRWLQQWRAFPGVILWRQEPRQEKSAPGAVVDAIEALARQDDPFAYPIVYLKPRK